MRICLLTNQELDTVPFPADDWPCDPRPFLPDAEWVLATLTDKASAPIELEPLIQSGEFDLFFNLCDGAADQDDMPGIEVIEMLERYGVPFTGATSNYYEPTRMQMKEACARAGIASPAGIHARTIADVARAADELRFPLFVKHYSSYASVDLTPESKVETAAELMMQAGRIMQKHGGALIEEYIDGIECTVLVVENADDASAPLAYTPIQYRFPEGEAFKHEDLKWVDYDGLSSFPVIDENLAARLRDESARFFTALGGAGFGRCDIRVDKRGTPFMLEINPNCGVFYPPTDPGSADIILAMQENGHARFAERLAHAAVQRHQ
ncbi:MAG: D-alanine--D-alanine ligase [Planctomycetes bacterium]|nr:D-alanine--D-alanine ligase [Planctomycetota bacterium]